MNASVVFFVAAASSAPTVPIVLGRAPALSSFALEIAKSEVAAIYERSGVAVEWSEGDDPGLGTRMIVLFREAETFPVRTDPRALGLALLDTQPNVAASRVLVVFSDRLERLVACECPVKMGRALGRVIAHEIGHSLKHDPQHSEQGLMRAAIPRLRWGAPHRQDFYFAMDDTQAIHVRLTQ